MLGFVSLLMDVSSEMIHSLLPFFMVGVLGASAFAVGMIEGLAESTALIVKVFSGVLSDYWGKRKVLALFGYALGALTKPLFAVAPLTARLPLRPDEPQDPPGARPGRAHRCGSGLGAQRSLDERARQRGAVGHAHGHDAGPAGHDGG